MLAEENDFQIDFTASDLSENLRMMIRYQLGMIQN